MSFALNVKGPVIRSWLCGTVYERGHGTQLFAATNADREVDDPTKTWFWDTPPFVVVRHFARDEVTDDEIKKLLRTYRIRTLEDLKRQMYKMNLESVLKEETAEQFLDTVVALSKKVKETAESIFRGEVVYDTPITRTQAVRFQ